MQIIERTLVIRKAVVSLTELIKQQQRNWFGRKAVTSIMASAANSANTAHFGSYCCL